MYHILRRKKPLWKESKTVACYVTGALVFLEIQRGKEGMESSHYHSELGNTSTCTMIFTEETKGLGKRDLKGSTRDFFLFNIWLFSKKSAEAAASIGIDLIGMVKTNTKRFCKATI